MLTAASAPASRQSPACTGGTSPSDSRRGESQPVECGTRKADRVSSGRGISGLRGAGAWRLLTVVVHFSPLLRVSEGIRTYQKGSEVSGVACSHTADEFSRGGKDSQLHYTVCIQTAPDMEFERTAQRPRSSVG